MRFRIESVCLLCVIGMFASMGRAEVFASSKMKDSRRVTAFRKYEFKVTEGQKATAHVPAMMSFRGATNDQIILSSEFRYSVTPDAIDIVADNLGMPRRNYRLVWDAPSVDSITVVEKLELELRSRAVLYTRSKMPYDDQVKARYAESLVSDEKAVLDDTRLEDICNEIRSKAVLAEHAVEFACDWVQENVKFVSGAAHSSSVVLDKRVGNCVGMANLLVAILRNLGIPAESVSGKFLRGDGGHGLVEVYFPDAGWVFYDPCNCSRGFSKLNWAFTAGYAFRVENESRHKWYDGCFFHGIPDPQWQEPRLTRKRLRPGPKGRAVLGAMVSMGKAPKKVHARRRSVRELIMDMSIAPGVREFEDSAELAVTDQRKAVKAKAEKRAQSKLKLAEILETAGKVDNAINAYRELVAKYPGTKAAQAGAEALDRLKQ